MIQMTLSQIATILGLSPSQYQGVFQGISIDSRTLTPGNLFVAIKGERVDGHDYLNFAQQQGAVAAIVTHRVESALPQFLVSDATLALGKIATAWREQFNLPIIAVTGSNGKTTLKNMIAAILTAACQHNESQVLATKGTLNNHLGLPLTLARLGTEHRYAAIEMGMNHFGEIEYLTKLTRPTVAVITNAGPCHLEGVGSIAGVARAKAEIFLGLPANGIAILNRDDAFYEYWCEQAHSRRIISFGLHEEADVSMQHLANINLPLLGKHNELNALAAIAATLAINIPLAAIKSGLESIKPAPGRMTMHTLPNDIHLIDDTYNANPFSLQAAVNTLANLKGKKIVILGDMRELGPDEKNIHQEVGEKIRRAGIDYLFTYGELTRHTADGFGENANHFTEQEKLIEAVKPFLHPQTTVLVKGSRSMRMEKVVMGLLQDVH